MKTSELTGVQLDYWATQASGIELPPIYAVYDHGQARASREPFAPSTSWADGGPIIEREKIAIENDNGVWRAFLEYLPCYSCGASDDLKRLAHGDTPLVAAMRCLVASKYGDEVPDDAQQMKTSDSK